MNTEGLLLLTTTASEAPVGFLDRSRAQLRARVFGPVSQKQLEE